MKFDIDKISDTIKKDCFVHIYEDFKVITYKNVEPDRYLISEFGNVFDTKRNKIVSPFKDTRKNKGYIRVGLKTNSGERKNISVHRLVAWEFCKGYNESKSFTMVNHKNASTSDNYYKNLEWCDHSHNMKHKFRNGHYYNGRRKFDEKTVHFICRELEKGRRISEICTELTGVKNPRREIPSIYDTIQKIHIRRLYTDIGNMYNF